MEALVILLLTVALAAGVVWWVTVGGLPFLFVGRRDSGSATARSFATPTESFDGGHTTTSSSGTSSNPASDPASDPGLDSSPELAAVPTAATRWPRPVLDPTPAPTPERSAERRRFPIGHRSARSTFTYAQPVEDPRPPFVLTLLRLVFSIALVAGLITLGMWGLGRLVYSIITRFFE